jgi:hypothetical protein
VVGQGDFWRQGLAMGRAMGRAVIFDTGCYNGKNL